MATFEEQLKSLEGVVERLEKGDLPLEESLALFEQGVTLSESCKKELDAAEGRGGAMKKRDEVHRMAEANKAFSHFRF